MGTLLAVGKDSNLLWSRSALLRQTGAKVISGNLDEAFDILKAKAVDLVVLCHTLDDAEMSTIAVLARQANPMARILRLSVTRNYDSSTETADATVLNEPELVISKVEAMLSAPRPSKAQQKLFVAHRTRT